jgi:poly(3-hydroxybutyrate) depolymerase
MIYNAYEAQANVLDLARPFAAVAGAMLRLPRIEHRYQWPVLKLAGNLAAFANLNVTYTRRPFAIDRVTVGNHDVAVTEEATYRTPFCTLLHFKKDTDAHQPRVLVVAPMSGHFATLLRSTVQTLLPDHDVYITDWHNIRDVPLAKGRFDLAAYIDHVIEFLRILGPGSHVLAVCQPCVPVLAAVALMAEDGDEAQPRSMTLMAGPIDTRLNPTKVNQLAMRNPISWFKEALTDKVPLCYKGARRHVYPGFMQLTAFMSMNLERHVRSLNDMAKASAEDDRQKYKVLHTFYEEYFAVMDLPAEFYLETVKLVFQDHALPLGQLKANGRLVNPKAIRRTALLTVEGERDDICGLGQTLAAQDLCSGLRQYMKSHHVQTGVGHYGVFSGKRWSKEIYPKVRDVIQMTS